MIADTELSKNAIPTASHRMADVCGYGYQVSKLGMSAWGGRFGRRVQR